ncbi:MAG: hypothetical protein M4D80_03560 [Myxococcota bacterium]|nr:hypothetical protein [Myxococcota bacterium]
MRTTLALVIVLCGCSSKPEEKTVDEMGIKITVPGNWDKKKRGDDISISSGMDGVILRVEKEPIKTIEDAKGRLIQGYKMREEKTLPSGVFLFDFDVDYGTTGKPMLLRHIEGMLPTAKGHVSCTLQLQPDQDAEPIKQACSSMKPI